MGSGEATLCFLQWESHNRIDNNKPEKVREHPAHHFTPSHVQKITKWLVHAYGLNSTEHNHPRYKPPNWDAPKNHHLASAQKTAKHWCEFDLFVSPLWSRSALGDSHMKNGRKPWPYELNKGSFKDDASEFTTFIPSIYQQGNGDSMSSNGQAHGTEHTSHTHCVFLILIHTHSVYFSLSLSQT